MFNHILIHLYRADMWYLDAGGIDGEFWLVDDFGCVVVKMIKHFLFIYAYICRLVAKFPEGHIYT